MSTISDIPRAPDRSAPRGAEPTADARPDEDRPGRTTAAQPLGDSPLQLLATPDDAIGACAPDGTCAL